jgi:hypothetical protein
VPDGVPTTFGEMGGAHEAKTEVKEYLVVRERMEGNGREGGRGYFRTGVTYRRVYHFCCK